MVEKLTRVSTRDTVFHVCGVLQLVTCASSSFALKVVKMKNGRYAISGTSPITGNKVFRIAGTEKPKL